MTNMNTNDNNDNDNTNATNRIQCSHAEDMMMNIYEMGDEEVDTADASGLTKEARSQLRGISKQDWVARKPGLYDVRCVRHRVVAYHMM